MYRYLDCFTVRSPGAALTLALGLLQPSSDCADQYLSATAGSGEP